MPTKTVRRRQSPASPAAGARKTEETRFTRVTSRQTAHEMSAYLTSPGTSLEAVEQGGSGITCLYKRADVMPCLVSGETKHVLPSSLSVWQASHQL